MRLFVAVWPADDVLDRSRRWPPAGHRRRALDHRDQWHVTLRFLGEVDDALDGGRSTPRRRGVDARRGRCAWRGRPWAAARSTTLLVPGRSALARSPWLDDARGAAVIAATTRRSGRPPEAAAVGGHVHAGPVRRSAAGARSDALADVGSAAEPAGRRRASRAVAIGSGSAAASVGRGAAAAARRDVDAWRQLGRSEVERLAASSSAWRLAEPAELTARIDPLDVVAWRSGAQCDGMLDRTGVRNYAHVVRCAASLSHPAQIGGHDRRRSVTTLHRAPAGPSPHRHDRSEPQKGAHRWIETRPSRWPSARSRSSTARARS